MLHCYINTKDWGGGERDLVKLSSFTIDKGSFKNINPKLQVSLQRFWWFQTAIYDSGVKGAERKNKWSASQFKS